MNYRSSNLASAAVSGTRLALSRLVVTRR
jgi:hypothetical protein